MTPEVQRVQDLVGCRFVEGGADPDFGLGCLGCLLEVHRRIGREIPAPDCIEKRTPDEVQLPLREWMRLWEPCQPEPWCAVQMHQGGEPHVGVLMSDLDFIIHASEAAGSVVRTRTHWIDYSIVGYFRLRENRS